MGKQKILQNRKNMDLDAGFGISAEDKKRAVAVDYVIDCNKRTPGNSEPRMNEK